MKKLLVVGIGLLMLSCNQDKTAYVDNKVLIQDYYKMKQTEKEFSKKSEKIQKEMDSVARSFQAEVEQYRLASESMDPESRQKKETQLLQRQQVLQRQQQQRSEQLRQESDAVIDSLITEVKDYVAEYGEKNNYTYIFGSNDTANIMYAKDGKDITQDVLKELNKGHETEASTDKKETEKE